MAPTSRRVKVSSALILGIALIWLVVLAYCPEDFSDFDTASRAAKGEYLTLDPGKTRYQVYGEAGRPTLVLIHSFNGYLESWTPNIDPLVAAGYRVVVYDLWGRGFSSRPDIDLSLPVFRAQLNAVIEQVDAPQVDLVGASFGAVIAADYLQHHPTRVNKLVLVGPAGWPQDDDKTGLMLNLPLLGDLAFHYFGRSLLKPVVEAYFYDQGSNQWAVDEWEKFASYPGFTRAALSTLRHAPVRDYSEGWQRLADIDKPVLFVWGKQDVSFPYTNIEKVNNWIPSAQVVAVEAAAHWVNIEKAEQVNNAIISFLTP